MNLTGETITRTAQDLLELNPQPIPRLRLLRDVLQLSPDAPLYQHAQEDACQHPHVLELKETQKEDGTWGRFHTMDSALKKRFPTTECAVERALSLGLDKDSPLLQRTVRFITAHMTQQAAWSDPPEKHDNPQLFPYFTRLVSAANLALIDNYHPLLDERRHLVIEMLKIAFRSGSYRNEDEIAARTEVTGIRSKTLGGFLLCKYGLVLLSSTAQTLPKDLEDRLLQYVLKKDDGVYYMYGGRLQEFPTIVEGKFASWLGTHEILARFPGWRHHAARAMEWVWKQRNPDGFWDFGSHAYKGHYFPLSADWRQKGNRLIDCSVRVLALLRRFTGVW